MTNERVMFAAKCPTCGRDAWWHVTRGTVAGCEGSSGRLRIVCEICPDTDPAVALAAVITGLNENPLTA